MAVETQAVDATADAWTLIAATPLWVWSSVRENTFALADSAPDNGSAVGFRLAPEHPPLYIADPSTNLYVKGTGVAVYSK